MKKKDFILIGVLAVLLVILLFVGKKLKNAHPSNPVYDSGNATIQFVEP